MKIGLALKDANMARCVRQRFVQAKDAVEEVRNFAQPGLRDVPDVYIVDSQAAAFREFCDWWEADGEERPTTIVLLSGGDERGNRAWKKYCLSRDIMLVEKQSSPEQTAEQVYNCIYDTSSERRDPIRKTVAFTGTTPNIGTTVAAFGTALTLARQTDRKIAYLCLNLKSSKIHHYLGVDKPALSLDRIRTDLKTENLTSDRLAAYCDRLRKIPNLYVLYGNMYREQAEYYTPEDIRHLLKTAAGTFDCCILDVNAYWDNAATVCAMLDADMKIVVTGHHLSYFQEDLGRWLYTGCSLFDLSPESFDLLVTRTGRGDGGYRLKEIRKESGLNIIGEIRNYPDLNVFLNEGKLHEFFDSSEQAASDLEGLARMIMEMERLPAKSKHRRRKSWLKPLKTLGG